MTRIISTILVAFFLSIPVVAAPQFLAVEGQLFEDAAGTIPVDSSSVVFSLRVISPAPTECVLYEESHTLNMQNSQGYFSLQLGSGTQSGGDYEDLSTLESAFNNSTGAVTPTNCVSGPNYTPASGDGRQLEITYDSGSGPQTLTQNIQIGSTAYALSAGSIDGVTSSDLLVNDTSGSNILDQTNLVWLFDSARYTELQALIDGTSSQYSNSVPTGNVSMNSQKVVDVADPTAANDAANKNYVDGNIGGQVVDTVTLSGLGAGNSGEVMVWDGAQWTAAAPSGDTTKLPLAGGTMTGNIDMGTNNISNVVNVTATSLGANSIAIYNGANYMGFQSAAGGADLLWVLPNVDGVANQVMATDGSGNLSWQSVVGSASNQGAGGADVFKQLNAGDLEFNSINDDGSGKITVTQDAVNDEVDLTVNEANLDPAAIPNTAAGNIAATDVQGAINELDLEKVAKAGDAMTGALTMSAQNEVRFADADSSNFVGFAAPAVVGSDMTWTLPATDGGSSNILATDGAGVLYWTAAGTGESNTASNQGVAGVGVFDIKNGSDLEFKNINAYSSKVTIFDDAANNEIDIDVNESNFDSSVIPNTAAGNIAATNIQAAINELDTEKADSGNVLLHDGTVGLSADWNVGGTNTITNLPTPTAASEAATKGYVDSTFSGVSIDSIADADNNTKIQVEESANDDVIRFDTAGFERMIIDPTGNVGVLGNLGVGTPTPTVELDVDTGSINAAEICDENNANCIDLSAGAPGDDLGTHMASQDISLNNYRLLGISSGGSPGSPALSFNGDADTGIYRPIADEIGFVTGATEQMRITNIGVGVGTNNPQSLFHVNGNIQIGNSGGGCSAGTAGALRYNLGQIEYCNGSGWEVLAQSSAVGDFWSNGSMPMTGELQLMSQNSATDPDLTFNGDSNTGLFQPAADEIAFSTAGTEVMRIGSSGRIGINRPVPGATLDVRQIASEDIFAVHDVSDNPKLVVDSAGSVGVGTSAPNADFQVYGNALIDGGAPVVDGDSCAVSGLLTNSNAPGKPLMQCDGISWKVLDRSKGTPYPHVLTNQTVNADSYNFLEFDFGGNSCDYNHSVYNFWYVPDGQEIKIKLATGSQGPCDFQFYSDNGSSLLTLEGGSMPFQHGAGELSLLTFRRIGNHVFMSTSNDDHMKSPTPWTLGTTIYADIDPHSLDLDYTSSSQFCDAYTHNIYNMNDGEEIEISVKADNGFGGRCNFAPYLDSGSTPLALAGHYPIHHSGERINYRIRREGSNAIMTTERFEYEHSPAENVGAQTTFFFDSTKLITTSSNCAAMNLHWMIDGGEYSLWVQGTVASTCTFSAYPDETTGTPMTVIYEAGGATSTNAGQSRLFNFKVIGNSVLVTWKDMQ